MPPSILLYGLLYTSLSCVSFDEGVFCKYLLGQNVFIIQIILLKNINQSICSKYSMKNNATFYAVRRVKLRLIWHFAVNFSVGK